jgi:hypothetical protein
MKSNGTLGPSDSTVGQQKLYDDFGSQLADLRASLETFEAGKAKLLRADGSKLFQLGRFKVEVRDEHPGELTTRLVEGMPPGTLLAHVRSSWPLLDATERPADAEAISGDTPYLVALGTPTIASHAKAGEEIFSLEVRHGLTGRLAAASEPRMKRDKIVVPAGTPVYGVAMSSSQTPYYDAEVVWCTPLEVDDEPLETYCFAPHLGSTSLTRTFTNRSPYTVTGVAPSGPGRNPPLVERGPADFGAPLDLVVRVNGAERKKVSISWSLAPRGQRFDSSWSLRRGRDDMAFLLIGELLLKIAPSPDGKTFEISTLGEIAGGDPLYMPVDATRLR